MPPTAPPRSSSSGSGSETTPLLAGRRGASAAPGSGSAGAEGGGAATKRRRPSNDGNEEDDDEGLARGQMFLLCFARMTEPVAFFSIFPYVAQMVQRNGRLPAADTGFYSGLVESLFSLAQMCCTLFWGRLADRVGRRPVLVGSLVGTALGSALFGLAASVGDMCLFRGLAGAVSGSSLVVRTVIGDRSTPRTQARAFSWFGFAGNVGIFLGPLLGGALADPARQMPALFGRLAFFASYPYALPGFVIAAIVALGALACALFLEETLDRKTRPGDGGGGDGGDGEGLGPPEQRPGTDMSLVQLVRAPGVAVVLAVYSHVMLLAFVFTAILPLALYTPVSLGGIGCSSFGISIYMAVQGGSQALWLLLVFPRLQRRLGTRGVLRFCAFAYPPFFVGYILMNALLRQGSEPSVVCFWIICSVVVVVGPCVSMSFTCVQLAIQDVSPHPHLLGTLNALALTLASAIRSFAPGLSTALYAVGVRNHVLYGHLAWVLLIPLSAVLGIVLKWLPESVS